MTRSKISKSAKDSKEQKPVSAITIQLRAQIKEPHCAPKQKTLRIGGSKSYFQDEVPVDKYAQKNISQRLKDGFGYMD